MERREFLATLSGTLAGLTAQSADAQRGRNVKWAVDLASWLHRAPVSFTEVLDVTKDTGFTGIRLGGYPACLKKYDLTVPVLQKELSKRGLHLITIPFGGPADDPTKHEAIEKEARETMKFLQNFGATDFNVFPPYNRTAKILIPERLRIACEFYNHLGDVAAEYGFKAGLHNHLDAIIEGQDEVELFLKLTDPKRFHFHPDTAHLYLAGCNVVELFDKYADRITFIDYKDGKNTPAKQDIQLTNGRLLKAGSATATFFNSIYDLGDGEVDFPALHRSLKRVQFKGWICPDLDYTRVSLRHSLDRSMKYVRAKLEPIYA